MNGPGQSPAFRGEVTGRWARWLRAGLLLLTTATALVFALHSLSDRDIWFHWRAGQDLLDGQLVRTNHYSFTQPDRPWVNHEWLFQALVAVTGKAAASGPEPDPGRLAEAWNLLRGLLVLVLALILGRPLWPARPRPLAAAAAAWTACGILLAVLLLWTRLILRPELLSYIILALLIPAVEQWPSAYANHKELRPVRIWLDLRHAPARVLLLTVLWAQCHGFSALAPVIVGIGGLLHRWQCGLHRQRACPLPRPAWALLLLLTVVMLAMTPSGWRGLLYPFQVLGQFSGTQTDLRTTISELVPLLQSPNSLGWTIALFQVSLVWAGLWIILRWPGVGLLRVVVLAAAAAASMTNQRNLGFYAVAFALLHHDPGFGSGSVLARTFPPRWRSAPAVWMIPAAMLLAVPLLWAAVISDGFYLHEGVARRFGGGYNPDQLPLAAMQDLQARPEPRVFANIDAAGFLLGTTPSRVFIDGRTEAYSPEHWTRYARIKGAGPDALPTLAESAPGAVCLALAGGAFRPLAQTLLDSPAWSLTSGDGAGLLWRKAPAALPEKDILKSAAERSSAAAAVESRPARRADHLLAAAYLHQLLGETGRQREALQAALAGCPNHPQVLHNLGNLEMGAGAFREAAVLFDRALRANPRLAGSALNAGVCWLRMEDPARAESCFARAAGIDPRDFQAWANLGLARQARGDRQGAIEALTRAVSLRPQDPQLRQRLAQLRR